MKNWTRSTSALPNEKTIVQCSTFSFIFLRIPFFFPRNSPFFFHFSVSGFCFSFFVLFDQTNLVMIHIDLEEKTSAFESSHSALKQKAEMCNVFESGLTELRKMLDAEIEEKRELEKSFRDLSLLQKKLQLTWMPDSSATRCMSCQSRFSRWGSRSKGHCRYCGRVFCKECTTQCALPELGYREKVKVCKPCVAFRSKIKGEADAGEEEEEEDNGGSAVAAAGSKDVLSYDSD
jgi:hypothetical protein